MRGAQRERLRKTRVAVKARRVWQTSMSAGLRRLLTSRDGIWQSRLLPGNPNKAIDIQQYSLSGAHITLDHNWPGSRSACAHLNTDQTFLSRHCCSREDQIRDITASHQSHNIDTRLSRANKSTLKRPRSSFKELTLTCSRRGNLGIGFFRLRCTIPRSAEAAWKLTPV